ncbi:Tat pathway signal protein [Shewanella sp. NFH-SH190041]|uniref:DUF1501 domain-containing protein n=1 Tax=Shewanella sp. NFH-SH190041 TaxID=2950245 RepID=UPI0021C41F5E|nr:DUF1501 domain-containing protein [Shewanella sp. NFH-SH190041]BDM62826.1 Tat pathway signal protein [Shewanella sp. NFH-SH190041]
MTATNRRAFLHFCLKGGVSLAALTSLQLQALQGLIHNKNSQKTNTNSSAIGQQQLDDNKALVCIFLMGGNDSFNMLLPLAGESLASYQDSKQNLAATNAIALSPLTAINDGVGLHPALAPLESLFLQQRLAAVGGVGSLISPITLAEYQAKSAAIPKHLFSHNDQQATWMQGREKASLNYGWGARLLELLEQSQSYASNISLAGTNLWQTGTQATPFAMSTAGITPIHAYNSTHPDRLAFRAELEKMFANATHPLAMAYSQKLTRAVANTEQLNAALGGATDFTDQFSDTSLSNKLKAVARTLSVQSQFGVKRQLFFVTMGGFDTHDDQNTKHPGLLAELANGFSEFDAALGQLGMRDSVTTFTMSDFGRTLTSNGDGTDHGWAGNQLVMGGAVKGGEIYGSLMEQRLGSPFDVGGGRLIPQVSNEQYFATLARWFGASDSELLDLFPSLSNFNQHTLEFMV